jgi:hypothetical protein
VVVEHVNHILHHFTARFNVLRQELRRELFVEDVMKVTESCVLKDIGLLNIIDARLHQALKEIFPLLFGNVELKILAMELFKFFPTKDSTAGKNADELLLPLNNGGVHEEVKGERFLSGNEVVPDRKKTGLHVHDRIVALLEDDRVRQFKTQMKRPTFKWA